MRIALLSFVLLSSSIAGCDPGVQCVVDTDCELGEYCSSGGACLLLGTVGDGGGGDAGPRDAGTRDAPAGDAPRADAPLDAPPDAPLTCPAIAGSYPLMSVGIGCPGLTAASVTLVGPAPTECAFEVQLDARSAGVVAQDRERGFSGLVDYDATGAVDCTLTVDETLTTLEITCGACMFTAMRPI